jgi:uncharacterized repeat protein (TIGR02543 family)
LHGVTIAIILNGGLFEQANEAVRVTDIAHAEEVLRIEIASKQLERMERRGNFTRADVVDAINMAGVLRGSDGSGWILTPGDGPWKLNGDTHKGNKINEIVIDNNGEGNVSPPTEFEVSFHTNYPSWSSNSTVTVSVAAGDIVGAWDIPFFPTPSGYAFYGWTLTEDGSGEQFTSFTEVNSNLDVYAQWVHVVP